MFGPAQSCVKSSLGELFVVLNSQLHWGLTWKHLSGIKGVFAADTLYNCTNVFVHLGTAVVQDAYRQEDENFGFHTLVKLFTVTLPELQERSKPG